MTSGLMNVSTLSVDTGAHQSEGAQDSIEFFIPKFYMKK